MHFFETTYNYYLGQSSHLLLFSEICLFLIRIFIKFVLKSLLLLQFPMDSFETRYTNYSLGQSSHLLFRFLKCVIGGGGANFHPIFIQVATAPAIFNGFH